MLPRPVRSFRLLLFVLSFGALACDLSDVSASFGCAAKPAVVITSPPSGSTYHEGEEVAVQSISTDAKGVLRVELVVDGAVIRTDSAPTPQEQYTLVQNWKATQGAHTIIVRSINVDNVTSDPAAISITVIQGTALGGTPIPGPSPVPPTTAPGGPTSPPTGCTDGAVFVADVTVPDGTVLAAGQTFNKIWRMRNSGCPWGPGYQFVFVSGEAMTASTAVAVPNTATGGTADILVAMTAPSAPGSHSGQWRMRNAGGALFGQTVGVVITVPGAPPPPPPATNTSPPVCPGPPVIASFSASPNPITAGGSTTLSWGAVTNATSATIDQGIGGVATPGSTSVSPGSTTTYTLTASGCGGVATSQVTVTVNPALPPPVAVIYDFIAKANFDYSSWKWQSTGSLGSFDLPFPGNPADDHGFALWRYGFTLNDGSTPAQVLETHPQWTANGTISRCYGDVFSSGYQVQASDHISGKVGFLSGAGAGNVTFRIRIRPQGLSNNDIVVIHSVYADGVKSFNYALGPTYNGRKADFCLIVEAGGTASQDWAVWQDVRIIR